MAVEAIQSKLMHMESMGERNRLLRLVADPCVFRCEIITHTSRQGRDHHAAAKNEL